MIPMLARPDVLQQVPTEQRRTPGMGEHGHTGPAPETLSLPLSHLREHGLLWLINRVCFHPRGFALAFDCDETTGTVHGWTMLGDGSEVWSFAERTDDDMFARAERFLARIRAASQAEAAA